MGLNEKLGKRMGADAGSGTPTSFGASGVGDALHFCPHEEGNMGKQE